MERKGIDFELVNYCEFDKYASKSYSLIHNVPEVMNLGDITKVNIEDLEPYSADLITYGFPCQDISNAGKQRGFEHDGQLTRSGLFFYASAIIGRVKPKVAICENVKALVGKKFTKEFETVLSTLEDMGYKNYWQVLNAKDYGIPQNRERVFIVSIRNDIDKKYEFPTPIKLELRLKDILEKQVDEKYYLSEKMIAGFLKHNEKHNKKGTGFIWKPKTDEDIANYLRANASLAPTDNSIAVREATKKGYAEAQAYDSINLEQPNSKTRRGRVGKQQANMLTTSCNQAVVEPFIVASRGRNPENPSDRTAGSPTEQRLESKTDGCTNTLTTVQKDNYVVEPSSEFVNLIDDTNCGFNPIPKTYTEYSPTLRASRFGLKAAFLENTQEPALRIRKLTPLECWRLMGFDDEDFYKAEKVNSNTQLYKQAGNSIVVNVLEAIFENLKDILCD